MNIEEFRNYCLSFKGVREKMPFPHVPDKNKNQPCVVYPLLQYKYQNIHVQRIRGFPLYAKFSLIRQQILEHIEFHSNLVAMYVEKLELFLQMIFQSIGVACL